MSKIIQNAIMCPDGTILRSVHRHDFQSHGHYSVDGGLDYLKRGYDPNGEKYIELSLVDDNSLEEKKDKLLWGTRGKKGEGPLRLVFLKDCTMEHLKAILKDYEDNELFSEDYKIVIESILEDKIDYRNLIKDPPEEYQLMAVRQNFWALGYIKNPSVKVQLAAIEQNREAFNLLKNPSQEAIDKYNEQ